MGTTVKTIGGIPSTLSDSQATALGLKPYLADKTGGTNDISYNGGNKATISLNGGGGTLSSVGLGRLYPYQDQSGSWGCRFNIYVNVSSATRTGIQLAVNGIVFASLSAGSYGAGVVGWNGNNNGPSLAAVRPTVGSGNIIEIDHPSVTTIEYQFAGDVPLASKPTWAY